jgi:mannitol-1-phosphate/altronate dehydrogenase
MEDLFGDIASSGEFVEAFSSALNSVWELGVQKTLENYISSHSEAA